MAQKLEILTPVDAEEGLRMTHYYFDEISGLAMKRTGEPGSFVGKPMNMDELVNELNRLEARNDYLVTPWVSAHEKPNEYALYLLDCGEDNRVRWHLSTGHRDGEWFSYPGDTGQRDCWDNVVQYKKIDELEPPSLTQ